MLSDKMAEWGMMRHQGLRSVHVFGKVLSHKGIFSDVPLRIKPCQIHVQTLSPEMSHHVPTRPSYHLTILSIRVYFQCVK